MPEYLEELLKKARKLEEKPTVEKKEERKEKIAEEAEIAGAKTLVTAYNEVKIYKVEGESLPIYTVPVIKATGPEKVLINTIKEASTRLITVSPEEIRDPQRRRDYYFRRVKEIITSTPELAIPETKLDFYAEIVVREMIGYGLLDTLVKDDKLEEIMVLGPNRSVYVFHRDYDMLKTNIVFGEDEDIVNLVSRMARDVNRRVDSQNPLLDARLPDGSRVNATIKPISADGATLTIRKFRSDPLTIIDLIRFNTISSELAAFLWTAVDGLGAFPANILVSGGAGSGKTTALNCLAAFIPTRERILTIEDTLELNLPVEHIIRFETRPPGPEMAGEITMDMLLKNSLRMRPDRIIVGEIRHAEAFTLFSALNTGHRGGLGTVHANSAGETITRLLSPPMNVPPIMLNALDFIAVELRIFDRRKGTIRRISELAEVTGLSGGTPQMQILYEWEPTSDMIRRNNTTSRYLQELQRYTGLSKEDIDAEMKKRQSFLEELNANNIRSIKKVITEFQKYKRE
jgi:flagellar protein FlaI